MSKTKKRILNAISYFIVMVVVILAFLTVGIKLFGINVYTVLSSSMEPNYKVGSLIYVKEIDPNTLKKGDVITYKLSNNMNATHRIVEIFKDSDSTLFRTKGDANLIPDEVLVKDENIIGKPIFNIPYLGYITTFIQTKVGKTIAILVGTFLVTIVFLIDIVIKKEK